MFIYHIPPKIYPVGGCSVSRFWAPLTAAKASMAQAFPLTCCPPQVNPKNITNDNAYLRWSKE